MLSKSDAKHLATMFKHAAAGNKDSFDRLAAAWLRSAPNNLVLAKRTAALVDNE